MSAHKGTTVTVLRTAIAGDPGLKPGDDPTTMKLVQRPLASPIISSKLVGTAVMPVPTQALCYSAPTAEIV